ncbi:MULTISPECIES: hypothetical protein [unclassified Streptosporangium]|uniref:hypothetical protein n=1 Tax=unclassified Streptosporangium TaxID=2632669 RepID=UPI002E27C097|nr:MULTISPECIES: hypothetical protein [unclassified Streptosporangium]
MPKFKSVLAGLAISTALTGGVVAMGAATTVTSAGAMTTAVTAGTFATWGGGGCCGRDRHRFHHRRHERFRVFHNNDTFNRNRLHNDTRSDRVVPLIQRERRRDGEGPAAAAAPAAPPAAAS